MNTLDKLMGLKHVSLKLKPNLYQIPMVYIPMTREGADEWNEIYDWVRSQEDISEIIKTPSRGICIDKHKGFVLPAYGIWENNTGVSLVILITEGMWRINFTAHNKLVEDDCGKSPTQCFALWKQQCKKCGIDFDKYRISNGMEVKDTMEKAMIGFASRGIKGNIFNNVHHIDFHSSHLGGLANLHPEFKPVVDYFFDRRHEPGQDKVNKAILTRTFGMCQQKSKGAPWAHLAKDMLADTNARIRQVSDDLSNAGRVPLLYNTDGIWYQGDIYHGSLEGTRPGLWENDYTNCKFRAKSKGAYEFIGTDIKSGETKYHAVLRGSCKLDKIKPRDQWEWGDIFRNEAVIDKFSFDPIMGIVWEEDDDEL